MKAIGVVASCFFGFILAWTLLAELEFLVIFIWPVLLALQLIFLSYWTFRVFNSKKVGVVVSGLLSFGFILIAMSPWISDWTFNKKDTKKLLSEQNIILKENFTIIKNESGGFRDYYQIFKVEISEKDKLRIINQIESMDNYQEETNNRFYLPELSENRYKGDTLHANYQTDREYKNAMYYPNGEGYTPTYRVVSISKDKNELTFEEILD
ncbi:hypothetical protein GTQ34_09650 [Muricauda sp. JGD-17]|uniref:Uncharacterized protein n=1 Tax=Flagellimonas ochracea TaxID=2696472 RepID=A0A964WXV0_9FLAO|nr:MFS transporter [Allomuricauda ochracea]NAY92183.1 hypothetical protein [Allomuricauda ochracea]